MKLALLLAAAALIFGTTLGCTGTETGNPPPRMSTAYSLLMQSSNPEEVSVGEKGSGITITDGLVGIGNVSVASDCSSDAPIAVTDIAEDETLDLVEGSAWGDFPTNDVCLLEIRIRPRDIGWANVREGSTSDLALGFAGTLSDGTPLFIESEEPLEAFFRFPNYTAGENGTLGFALDVANLLDFEELEMLTPNADGVVVLSAAENSDALAALHSRWAGSWSFNAYEEGEEPLQLTTGTDM